MLTAPEAWWATSCYEPGFPKGGHLVQQFDDELLGSFDRRENHGCTQGVRLSGFWIIPALGGSGGSSAEVARPRGGRRRTCRFDVELPSSGPCEARPLGE